MSEPISQFAAEITDAGHASRPHGRNEATLMGLPVELRRQILAYLLTFDPQHDWVVPGLWKEHESDRDVAGFDVSTAKLKFHEDTRFQADLLMCRHGKFDIHTQILATCKQLYLEGTSMLLNENEFVAMIGMGGVFDISGEDKEPGHLGLCRAHTDRLCSQVLRMPNWEWDESRASFTTPRGLYCPSVTIDWGCGEKKQVVILSVAELRGFAGRIPILISMYHNFRKTRNPAYFPQLYLPQYTDPRMFFRENSTQKHLKGLGGIPLASFVQDYVFACPSPLDRPWQVKIGEHARTERTFQQAWEDRRAEEDIMARQPWWSPLMMKRNQMFLTAVWNKFELLKWQLTSKNTKDALPCLQDLLHQVYEFKKLSDFGVTRTPAVKIAALAKYLVSMQPDCGGFFESDMAFMQWAVLNLMDSYTMHAFEADKWQEWVHIRLGELFVHTGNSERMISTMVKVGKQFASPNVREASKQEWTRNLIRRRLFVMPSRGQKVVKHWKFSDAQKQRAAALAQEWREKLGLTIDSLLDITLNDIIIGPS